MRTLHRAFAAAIAVLTLLSLACTSRADGTYRVSATSRIKDLANIEGVRQNQLIGYGLVVGLNGTGDTLNNVPFTKQSLTAMLERLGVNIRGQTIRTGNVAAVGAGYIITTRLVSANSGDELANCSNRCPCSIVARPSIQASANSKNSCVVALSLISISPFPANL